MKDGTTVNSQQRVLVFKLGANFTAGITLRIYTGRCVGYPRFSEQRFEVFPRIGAVRNVRVQSRKNLVFGVKAEGRMSSETLRTTHRGSWLRLFPTRPCLDPRRSFWNISEAIISVLSPRLLTGRFCMEFICVLKFIFSKPPKELSVAIKDPVWIQLFPRFGWEAYTLGKNCQLDPFPLELNITKVSALRCFSKCFSGTDCSKGVHDDKVGLS